MAGQPKESILAVDDDQSVLAYIRGILTARGYRLYTAESGEEALNLAASLDGTIDLLLTDVFLPAMDGRHLAGEFLARYPQAKVLFISGYFCPAAAHQDTPNSGKAFVQKPFTANSLVSKMRAVLDSEFRPVASVADSTA
jgi:two-component system cell cycle sensor histidine kinase/response regulator CckA